MASRGWLLISGLAKKWREGIQVEDREIINQTFLRLFNKGRS